MPSFGTVALPDINPLAAYYASGRNENAVAAGRLANQGSEQDLTDRATLRGLASGLGARDPNAQAGAAVLPNGAGAVTSLSNADAQTAASKLQLLQYQQGLYSFSPAGGATPAAPAQPATGDFTGQMGAAEAPSPGTVNPGGYSGQFQFGAARLSDPGVGVYTPAQGEDVSKNQWSGTFNIPGFPDVKTHAQFLANPDAQKAVFATHVADIDSAIAQTPGANGLNQNGLRAVAHLGGVAGMQKFVATGGQYNPVDANGVHLSDYYTKFSQGGPAALQAAFGHPDGPPGAAPAQPVQYATRGPMPGQPVTATDASPAPPPAATPPGPGFDANGQPLAAGTWDASPAPSAPTIPNQNALLPVAGGAPPPAPVNQLMPSAGVGQPAPTNQLMAAAPAQTAPAAPAQAPSGAPVPGERVDFARNGQGQYNTAGLTPGYAMARVTAPDGSQSLLPRRIPGLPQNIEYQKTENEIVGIDKATNQVVSRVPITNSGRITPVQTAGGTQLTQGGATVGPVIPFSGRPEQADAYKADIPQVQALTSASQNAQASMPRLNEMAELIPQLSTGPTAELRAKGAALLEQLGASPESIKRFTGMSSGAQAQELVKLSISTAGAAAKADVGSNNGIQSTQLYQSANPGLMLLPDANKRVTNMLRVASQSTQDYAQAALQHFGTNEQQFLAGGNYAPMTTFNRQWQSQANPQVYAAATGILNGDSFDKWSAKITPAEGARAAQIAARVDPTVQVPLKGGGMRPVRDILSHPSIAAPN